MQEQDDMQGQDEMPEMDIEEIIMFYEGSNPEFGIPDFDEELIASFLDMARMNETDTLGRLIDAYTLFAERCGEDEEDFCAEKVTYLELALLAFLADYDQLSMEDLLESKMDTYALFYEDDYRLVSRTDYSCETYESHTATSRNNQYTFYEMAINLMTPYYATRIFEKDETIEVPLWHFPGQVILLEPIFRTKRDPNSAMELLTRVVEERTGDDMMQFLTYPFTYHRN